MSSRYIFPSENYVIYDKDRNTSTCLKCNKQFKGKRSNNIKTHYRSYHKENVELIPNECYHVSVGITKNEFIKCCVGLVTVKNLPFQFFDDNQCLKRLIAPYEKKFGTNFNAETMAHQVSHIAQKLKEHISDTVKNKMVCLKLDVVTGLDENCSLAILTIHYMIDFKILTNTIGLVRLYKDQTEVFLKNEIIQRLKEVKIEIGQIYSCTPGVSTIGPSILKTSILLKELQETWIIHNEGWDSTDESGEEDDDYKLSHVLAVVRCAEDNIQLAADDVFEAFTTNIAECRAVVNELQIVISSIEQLEETTKWKTIYTMFKSIEGLRDVVDNTENNINLEIDWSFVSDFICAFKPLINCANKFKSEPYIIGDFYRDWLLCETELEEIVSRNGCAQLLLEAMGNRKARLLENEAFVSALYVDPRFNFLNSPFLSDEQKEIAVRHLLNTNSLMKLSDSEPEANLYSDFIPSTSLCSSNSHYKLECKMRRMAGVSLTDSLGRSVGQKLENLSFFEWIPFESNVLQYWKRMSSTNDQLNKLIQVVLSVPATDVSNERVYSALSAFQNMGNRFSKETTNDLLLIKLNHLIFDSVDI